MLLAQKESGAVKEPNGFDLMSKLIELYAEQEGVKIKIEYIGERK